MRSVYVCGGPGAGKSTFTQQLMDRAGINLGGLQSIHQKMNSKNLVTLRGHEATAPWAGKPGIYLGVMRDQFPGTDAMDRASHQPAIEWLGLVAYGLAYEPQFLVSEGKNLALKPFLAGLRAVGPTLLVHLTVDPVVADIRFIQRGAGVADTYLRSCNSQSANLYDYATTNQIPAVSCDSTDPEQWEAALASAVSFLKTGEIR